MLKDPETAGAIFYISKNTANSDFVLNVEAPAIFSRAKDPDFLIIPIAAEGLDYAEASSLFDGKIGTYSLSDFNMERSHGLLTETEADRLALRIVRQRLRLAAKHKMPLSLSFTTRKALGFDTSRTLSIDHQSIYLPANNDPQSWHRALRILSELVDVIESEYPSARIDASGFVGLSYAIALGYFLSNTRGLRSVWRQLTGSASSTWMLTNNSIERHPIAFRRLTAGGNDLALLLSVNDDVAPAFSRIRNKLPELGAIVELDARHLGALTPEHAEIIARSAISGLRDARSSIGEVHSVHIFGAMPAGLAFLIGQLLNTFPRIETYEFNGLNYEPALHLRQGIQDKPASTP